MSGLDALDGIVRTVAERALEIPREESATRSHRSEASAVQPRRRWAVTPCWPASTPGVHCQARGCGRSIEVGELVVRVTDLFRMAVDPNGDGVTRYVCEPCAGRVPPDQVAARPKPVQRSRQVASNQEAW